MENVLRSFEYPFVLFSHIHRVLSMWVNKQIVLVCVFHTARHFFTFAFNVETTEPMTENRERTYDMHKTGYAYIVNEHLPTYTLNNDGKVVKI